MPWFGGQQDFASPSQNIVYAASFIVSAMAARPTNYAHYAVDWLSRRRKANAHSMRDELWHGTR
jgi:hypothetical protein